MPETRFKNSRTEKLFYGQRVKGFAGELADRTQKKLKFMHAAAKIESLAFPPGNHLEKLGGSRAGQWSIRINRQWRICFEWQDGRAVKIEVVDYH